MVKTEKNRAARDASQFYSLYEDYSADDEHEFVERCQCGEVLHQDQGRICAQRDQWAAWYYLH